MHVPQLASQEKGGNEGGWGGELPAKESVEQAQRYDADERCGQPRGELAHTEQLDEQRKEIRGERGLAVPIKAKKAIFRWRAVQNSQGALDVVSLIRVERVGKRAEPHESAHEHQEQERSKRQVLPRGPPAEPVCCCHLATSGRWGCDCRWEADSDTVAGQGLGHHKPPGSEGTRLRGQAEATTCRANQDAQTNADQHANEQPRQLAEWPRGGGLL